MNVAILFDAAAERADAPADVRGVMEAVEAVEIALSAQRHVPVRLPVSSLSGDWLDELRALAPDLVFNLCEGVDGDASAEAAVARAVEALGLRLTGAGSAALDRCRDKHVANGLLSAAGLPVPEWRLVDAAFDRSAWTAFPAIVKPAGEDASVGITSRSVAHDPLELAAALDAAAPYAPLLVQRYVEGRELNAAIVGGAPLPLAEIRFAPAAAGVVSYAAKWDYGSADDLSTVPVCPAELEPALADAAADVARGACAALGVDGYARVDLRVDGRGRVWILEVNPNPDLAPSAGLARMARAAGWSHERLVARVVSAATSPDAVRLGPLLPAHRATVEALLRDTGFFRESEVAVGLEVLDSYFRDPDHDYSALGAFTQLGGLLGYVCYGPTPGTVGAFDLYWIAVSPDAQGRGIGTTLLQEVERRLSERHARLVIVETSGTAVYTPTRGFYEARGYREVARVPDFYDDGDDRVIFARRMRTISRENR